MRHVVIEFEALLGKLPNAADGKAVHRVNFEPADMDRAVELVARNIARQCRAKYARRKTRSEQFRVFQGTSNLTLATVRPSRIGEA